MALNACKKESDNTTSKAIADEPASSELVTTEPTLDDFRVGEKWVWLEKSVAEGKIRWEGKELKEVVAFKGSLGFWYGKDTVLISNTLNQEQSSTPYWSWPLKVGKKWKNESEWKNAEGTPMTTSMDVEVVSYGEEAVLAGRFAAYKIEYKGTITNSIGGAADIHETYWYAPELKVNIKKVQDDGYGSYVLELYDYKKGE
jgi:hypothetical protein